MRASACAVFAAAFSFLAAEAFASASFDCEVTPLSPADELPKRLLFHFDRGFARARIEDKRAGRDETVHVSRYSLTSVVLNWTAPAGAARLPSTVHPERTARLQKERPFRVVMNLDNLKMSVLVQPEHPGGTLIRGAGVCTRFSPNEKNASAQWIVGSI